MNSKISPGWKEFSSDYFLDEINKKIICLSSAPVKSFCNNKLRKWSNDF
jgi:hypothetical protein